MALVSMPIVAFDTPSIQLGLLKALAASAGFPVTNYHLALDFARQIGPRPYRALAQHRGTLVGEWLFAAAAFGARVPARHERFLADFDADVRTMLQGVVACPVPFLQQLQEHHVPAFLDRVISTIPWQRFRVVGFTSCFQQNAASFALARLIKRQWPEICTVFGGANFDDEMGRELVRTVESIDYAIAGEADVTFTQFLACVAEDGDPAGLDGVICQRQGRVVAAPPAPPYRDLDALPTPDYDDYFARAESLGLLSGASRAQVRIPFESSRGCWWGEKHHCTFCGLNGEGMAFRAKSPPRVFAELSELALRYRTFRFDAVDNILAMEHLEHLLPRFVEEGVTYTLFFETKANLKREMIARLRHAGVTTIQPGIESMNSHVLQLMRKGTTAAQNVNLLRWARYYGVRVIWNVLWGFPGETEDDYRHQAALLPHLMHLQPPLSASRIWMERFSPIYVDRDRFPVRRLDAERSYGYVYPESTDLRRVAYFFDYEFEDSLPEPTYGPIVRLAHEWQRAWESPARPRLTFRASPGLTRVEDHRRSGEATTYTLTGPLAAIYTICSNSPRSAAALEQSVNGAWTAGKIRAALDGLCHVGLVMCDGERYLSLALPDDKPGDEPVTE